MKNVTNASKRIIEVSGVILKPGDSGEVDEKKINSEGGQKAFADLIDSGQLTTGDAKKSVEEGADSSSKSESKGKGGK